MKKFTNTGKEINFTYRNKNHIAILTINMKLEGKNDLFPTYRLLYKDNLSISHEDTTKIISEIKS
jgi:hypothetical protein